MTSSNMRAVGVSLALLALASGLGQQPVMATGGLLDGSLVGGALNAIPDVMNSATNMVNGLTSPVMGALGPLTGGLTTGLNGVLSSSLGGMGTLTGGPAGLLGNSVRLATGTMTGLTSGLGNGLGGLANSNGLDVLSAASSPISVSSPNGLAHAVGSIGSSGLAAANAVASAGIMAPGMLLRNNFKREAIADGMMNAVNDVIAPAAAAGAALTGAAVDSALGEAAQVEPALLAGSASGVTGALVAGAAANAAANSALAGSTGLAATGSLVGRQVLAADAIRNAQAESAAAGAEMVQNGAINARSASMAGNAYRQAKLASARDRVNIAGTIQNSARISDAAIATHDTATKAEDSLLGSELAVDSAATVFDSDGAYIPPVTASLLRSLPYGRLGLRNIIPKPLTHPSVMLPDVWLNGVPVNYQNIPLRMLPYGIGPAQSTNSLMFSQAASANGAIINAQPFLANNGIILNGLVFDPAYAYLNGANINGIFASSLMPILANGQLEAQDELAMANLLNVQQLNGVGMSTTYQGYGRLNPVPMITGSVSDINLMPTTTIGTTYPIGSALVIEPRDSFFQDYTDNASSRQNFDERQQ